MEFNGKDHVYKCQPKEWWNLDGSITLNLKCAPKPDIEGQQRASETYAVEERANKQREFVSSFVVSIEGLVVDGKPITTFEDLFKCGPPDIYDWAYFAVLSQRMLTDAEVKN
jgi:hypothetical protein